MMRRERARGSLAMNEEIHHPSIHHMLFGLRDVVRHVVDHMHVEIVRRHVENAAEGLSRQERQHRPIHPREVGRRRHAAQVILSLRRVNGRARELSENQSKHTTPPVVDDDAVLLHHALHVHQRVGSHLMSQAATARVDHDEDLSTAIDAHLLRTRCVEDLVDYLDLRVVVACAESSHLREAALLRASGDFGGVCVEHATVFLAVLLVFAPGVAFAQTPVHAQTLR